jgi:N-acetyl-1-D-myo-inositol-2-amino-2-deoxy-alpha-D-glucopyranoside deacetylase
VEPFGARVLFVHAHPDDESIATGGTIALLAGAGVDVTVLTCTRGELGEIVAPDLADADLVAVREREIADALAVLGGPRHRWLGEGRRRYTDSGMQWGADGRAEPTAGVAASAFTAAPIAEALDDLLAVVADVRPSTIVSYDALGGYGHPDHVRAEEVARAAADAAGLPFIAIESPGAVLGEAGERSFAVDVSAVLDRKRSALAVYRSQLVVERSRFAGANGEWEPITSVEKFRVR